MINMFSILALPEKELEQALLSSSTVFTKGEVWMKFGYLHFCVLNKLLHPLKKRVYREAYYCSRLASGNAEIDEEVDLMVSQIEILKNFSLSVIVSLLRSGWSVIMVSI